MAQGRAPRAEAGRRIILGAGCAGLSLACALLEAGIEDELVLIDRRRAFPDDRTWCFWDVGDANPFASAAEHAWARWRLVGPAADVFHHAPAHRYHHLSVGAMRAAALARLAAAGDQVRVRTGEPVQGVEQVAGGVAVRTARGVIRGGVVYDGMAAGSPRRALAARRGPALVQSFVGLEVTTSEPLFDPGVPTVMDTRAPQDPDLLHFLYVLPFGPDRALLEHTTLGPHGIAPAERREAIDEWLAQRGARITAIHREERGRLPMARSAIPDGPAIPIGTVAGAIRPSSGYAFSRIQAHSRALASAAARGDSEPVPVAPPWLDLLDEIFLRVLERQPHAFADWFPQLGGALGGPGFARFMTDAARPDDVLRAIAALPKLPFLRGAIDAALDRLDPYLARPGAVTGSLAMA